MIVSEFIGKKFGMLTVVADAGRRKSNNFGGTTPWVIAICECGGSGDYVLEKLRSGHTQTCGCSTGSIISKSLATHGASGSPLYKVWSEMKRRCDNPADTSYPNYGGRGISYDARWSDFVLFREDMGDRPAGKTLERVDNDGDYCKENCRWATRKEQGRNKSSNRVLEAFGESKLLIEWAESSGIAQQTIWKRLNRGWDVERAVSEPSRPTNPKYKK